MPATYPPESSNMAKFQRRVAIELAPLVLPEPVGECVQRELQFWHEMGWRFGGTFKMAVLIDHILRRGEKLNATEEQAEGSGDRSSVGNPGRTGRQRDDNGSHDGRVQ